MLGTAPQSEATDAELACGDVDGELVIIIGFSVWSQIRRAALDHAVLAAAESGGAEAVKALIGHARSASVAGPPR